MDETSLTTMVLARAERYGSKRVMLHKHNGRWQDISWQTLGHTITRAAQGLAALGFRAGDRLAILSDNRPEWTMIDLACLFLGGVDVPLYPTSPAADTAYILKDAGVSCVAVAGQEQREKILQIAQDLPALSSLILLDGGAQEETGRGRLSILSLDGLLALGERHGGTSQPVSDPGLASIIYTSGTTGPPKGVMLSHANILANIRDSTLILPIHEEDLTLSFLPLSHVFERTAGLYVILQAGASIAYGGGPVSLMKDLKEVRPSLLACVPRVLELVYRRVWRERENAHFLRRSLLDWVLGLAQKTGRLQTAQQALPFLLGIQHRLADRLVFQKLRTLFGGHLRCVVCGGAPLQAEIVSFLHAAGIPVYAGYGLTEAAPVVACNFPGRTRLGSVGPVFPQVEVQIAADGEICVRGPNVMQGYYNRPQDTAEAIDTEGWLHTGDIGSLDDEGFLTITDRKKDLIITSEGENIAPQPIEGLLKHDPLIEEACVIGDKRAYLSVLIVPDQTMLEALARKHGWADGWPELLKRPALRCVFRRCVDEVNKSLPGYARIRTFGLLQEPFSLERGELTPTLKVKRRVVAETRRAQIEALYQQDRHSGG